MKIATVKLTSVSPYSQSRHFSKEEVKPLEKEGHDAYEKRTWRNRLHVDKEGHVFIPPMAFKNCLSDAARYLSVKIPGKGQATFTKHFESGVLCTEPLILPIKAADVESECFFVPSDGKRGGAKRVYKYFPVIPQWSGVVPFHILDETISKDVFEDHLDQAGKFIGIGRFRPQRNGYYGRFDIEILGWE